MRLFFDPQNLDLSQERIERDFGIPEIPLHIPPPGFYRADLLQWSYLGMLPDGRKPWDLPRCKEMRVRQRDHFHQWAVANYTWDQFLGEVNWLPDHEALALLELLLERDILHEMRRGVLQARTSENTHRAKRLSELDRMLAWIRVGNRWAWWIDALEEVPDPKYHPIPRLNFDVVFETSSGGAGRVRKHLQSVEQSLFRYALSREFIEILSAYILYALGFQAEPPQGVAWEAWGDLVRTLDLDLMLRWPASYLGYLLAESKVGRGAAFFPTPMSVATMIVEMVVAGRYLPGEGEEDPDSIMARRQALCESFSEPAAGAGDLILAASNYLWQGGPFWDIVPAIANAGRAQLALYAPWYAQSYLLASPPGGSLAAPDDLAQQAAARQQELIVERQRAIYAMQDWYRRYAARFVGSPEAVARIQEERRQTDLMLKHIRHRAEARASRPARKILASLQDLLTTDTPTAPEPSLLPAPIVPASMKSQISLFDIASSINAIDVTDAGDLAGSG